MSRVFATDTLAMSFRRGWTHGVLAQLTLPIVLTGAMLAVRSAIRRQSRARSSAPCPRRSCCSRTSACCCTCSWTSLNSYGVRLLMPFSEALVLRRRALHRRSVAVRDARAWLVARRSANMRPNRSARAHRRGARRDLRAGDARPRTCIARREVRERPGARRARPADTRFMVTPVVVNPFRREVVIDVGDRYEKGNLWFDPLPHFRPAGFGMEKGLDDPERAAGAADCRWRSAYPAVVAVPVRPGRSGTAARRHLAQRLPLRQRRTVWMVGGQAAVSSVR